MNGTFDERSQSSFDRAQSHYDHMEPPEPCRVCDGTGRVRVASIQDVEDRIIYLEGDGPEVGCPFCVDGAPPSDPDPDRKYDLLREQQWDGDYEMQRRDSLADLPR